MSSPGHAFNVQSKLHVIVAAAGTLVKQQIARLYDVRWF
jgi:hypothetical protein